MRGRPVRVALGVALGLAVLGLAALVGVGDRGDPVRPGTWTPPSTGPAGSPPATAAARAGWERVEPGGRTMCARGGRFAFWARMGAPDRLLVYFEGGGGCWDYRSCAVGSTFFDDRVDGSDDPAGGAGVLDLDDPRNPFLGWSVLYVPSCGGDVYAGDATRTYRDGGRSVTVRHRGYVNASAALEWVFERVREPRQVFVAGCSAGSVGSILHTPRVVRQYPRARVAQLGDSLGYLFSRPTDLRRLWGADRVLPDWVPGVRALPRDRFTMAEFYRAVARHHREVAFTQVNFREDLVQRRFYEAAGGAPAGFEGALLGNLEAIRAGSPNFRSCLLEGAGHCALPRAEFYTLSSGGVGLRDWVADLAAGRAVGDLPGG
jgi:pectinacetylesterase